MDIRVRDDGRSAPRPPRAPAAADAPEAWDEACLVPNASINVLCLPGTGGVDAGVLALASEARSRLTIPLPAPTLRPLVRFGGGEPGGLTGVPIWLWTDPAHWTPGGRPLTRAVRAGAVRAVVAAAPVRIVWRPGDGSRVVCRTAGTPLTDAAQGPAGSPDCGHTYRRSGQYRVSVAITWAVTWAGSDGSSGALAPLVVTAAFGYPVRSGHGELVSP